MHHFDLTTAVSLRDRQRRRCLMGESSSGNLVDGRNEYGHYRTLSSNNQATVPSTPQSHHQYRWKPLSHKSLRHGSNRRLQKALVRIRYRSGSTSNAHFGQISIYEYDEIRAKQQHRSPHRIVPRDARR